MQVSAAQSAFETLVVTASFRDDLWGLRDRCHCGDGGLPDPGGNVQRRLLLLNADIVVLWAV
jgi:hypothetical protein